jgi:hypothetical protein
LALYWSNEESSPEELYEIAVHISDAKRTQSQVIQLGNVEVNFDSSLFQLIENVIKVMDREACLEYPVNLKWILDARDGFRQRPRFGILDKFENIIVISKQCEP